MTPWGLGQMKPDSRGHRRAPMVIARAWPLLVPALVLMGGSTGRTDLEARRTLKPGGNGGVAQGPVLSGVALRANRGSP